MAAKQPKNRIIRTINGKLIELRRIHHNERFSQETDQYQAQIWVDGIHLCDVENQGVGGGDLHHPVGKHTHADVLALSQWIGSVLPAETRCGITLKEDLESVCHDLLGAWLAGKRLDRMIKDNLPMIEGVEIFTLKGKFPPGPEREAKKLWASKAWPTAKFLEDLPREEALKFLRGRNQTGE